MTTINEMCRKVRIFCSECMGGKRMIENVWPIENPGLVDDCPSKNCGWWEFRSGKDPRPNEKKSQAGKIRGFPSAKANRIRLGN